MYAFHIPFTVDRRRQRRNNGQSVRPLTRGDIEMLPTQVVLYTRQGCCLCDDAHILLQRFGISPKLVDIDQDPALREKFTTCVPVVEIDGKVRFRGRVNEVLLRRLLHPEDAATG